MSPKSWKKLGIATEVFHVFFIFAVLIGGQLWMPPKLVQLAAAITVMSQIIFLWCPLSVFSAHCFCKADPEYKLKPSLSLYLYRRFGRKVGIPIFIVLIVISTLVGKAQF